MKIKLLTLLMAASLGIGASSGSFAQTTTTYLGANYFKVTTPYGYTDYGAMNYSWSHFQTDRPNFYFNKSIYIDGSLHSYTGNDLNLGTYGTTTLTISESDAFVGIGTTSPTAKLHLEGAMKVPFNWVLTESGFERPIIQTGWINGVGDFMAIKHGGNNTEGNTYGVRISDYEGFVFGQNDFSDKKFVIEPTGNVGIGTASPDKKLTVNGTIHASEVLVDLSVPAPDYVFALEYQLRSLKDTEEFIKANSHLPEIPSAKEMETNGVELGEMNMLLLKKIEELTLHLIGQQKEIETWKAETAALRKSVQKLSVSHE